MHVLPRCWHVNDLAKHQTEEADWTRTKRAGLKPVYRTVQVLRVVGLVCGHQGCVGQRQVLDPEAEEDGIALPDQLGRPANRLMKCYG